MKVAFNYNKPIFFTSSQDKEDKKTEKKIIAGGGTVAGTATIARANAAKNGFNIVNETKKISEGMKGVQTATSTATNVAKKTVGLWGKVKENAAWATNKIIKWGESLKNAKYIKPLINSKAFRFSAGALGYGFGLVTLISGLSDIAKVTTDTLNKN